MLDCHFDFVCFLFEFDLILIFDFDCLFFYYYFFISFCQSLGSHDITLQGHRGCHGPRMESGGSLCSPAGPRGSMVSWTDSFLLTREQSGGR